MIRHYDITLTGVAQRVSTVLGITVGGPDDLPFSQLIVAAHPANSNAIFIGGASTVSATSYGFSLDPTQATAKDRESIGPFPYGPVKLSDLWVFGTNAEVLHILGVPL